MKGEKDADTLAAAGYCATCNVGGAGKWLAAYTGILTGKDVVLCGDNDEPGQKHVALIFESLAGKVRTARVVDLPKRLKDVTEFAESFAKPEEFKAAFDGLITAAAVHTKGYKLPLYFMADLEDRYRQHVRNLATSAFDLGKWLPTLGKRCRSLVPGELVLILALPGSEKRRCSATLLCMPSLCPLCFSSWSFRMC